MENLIYTWIQIAHNFGAVAVVGSPAMGWWLERKNIAANRLALVALLGFFVQGATGIGFAITSYSLKGAVPEVAGIALAALLVKVSATVIGFLAAAILWKKSPQWLVRRKILIWQIMLVFSIAALMGAAVLRWYL
jgi:hypothetical protein